MSIVVKTNKTEEIILINKKIMELDLEVDAKRGRYIIDGKSLMGLLSLNFIEGVELIVHESNNKESINEFVKFIQTYIR